MLQKAFRLPANASFTNSKSLHTKSVVTKYLKNNLTSSRFGFVVSKRISKKAVVRNRIKRQLRARIEANIAEIANGYDMLCVIKRNIPEDQIEEFDEVVRLIKERIQ